MFSPRAANVAYRGSSAHSGCPTTGARRRQNFSFGHPTMIQESLVWNAWNGTSDGCAECRGRDGTKSVFSAQVPG